MTGMRGGPRLVCSPYLTGSLGLMLLLVGFNYWNVSTQNHDLVIKIKEMQEQLRVGSERIEDLQSTQENLKQDLGLASDLKGRCEEEKSDLGRELQEKIESIRYNKDAQDTEVRELTEANEKTVAESASLKKKVDTLEKERDGLKDKKDVLARQKENLEAKLLEIQKDYEAAATKAADLQGKLSELLVQNGHVEANAELKTAALGAGQLPDVDPAAVSVVKKDTFGGPSLKILEDKYPGSALKSSSQGPPVRGISSSSPVPSRSSAARVLADAASSSSARIDAQVQSQINRASNREGDKSVVENENVEKIIEAMSKDQDYKGDKVDSKEEKDTKEDKGAKDKGDEGAIEHEEQGEQEDNLDRGEADSFIPQLENADKGLQDIAEDDQDPNGEVVSAQEDKEDNDDNNNPDMEQVAHDSKEAKGEEYQIDAKHNSDVEVF